MIIYDIHKMIDQKHFLFYAPIWQYVSEYN